MWVFLFDFLRANENVAVVHIGHHDNQFEISVGQFAHGLLLGGHLGEARRITQRKGRIFIEYLLIHASVVFQHKRIILGGYEQHVVYTLVHQFRKGRIAQNDVF